MTGKGARKRIGWWLRCWADRIDPKHGPRRMSGIAFTFELGKGAVFNEDGYGCPLWYMAEDYDRSWTESRSAR